MLVQGRAEMLLWNWYQQKYQDFGKVSTLVLGFMGTNEKGRNHIFLSDSGLFRTILDYFLVPKGRIGTATPSR